MRKRSSHDSDCSTKTEEAYTGLMLRHESTKIVKPTLFETYVQREAAAE